MAEHECFIGARHHFGGIELITLSNLKKDIQEAIRINSFLKENGIESWLGAYSLKDYADGRKGTNLTRFVYCPMCGKEIAWAAIRRTENAE